MKLTIIHLVLCFFGANFAFSQTITVQQYIDQYKDIAIREMKRMGVPAAITLAQGILETQSGNSDLVRKSNNHFGIKCKSSWSAGGVSHDDDAPGECFRVYKNAEESYRDHSNFLRAGERYSFLFKLDPTDYVAWAKGLRQAGYATNPRYPDILVKNIEENHLQQYTLLAANDVPNYDGSKYRDEATNEAYVARAEESTNEYPDPEAFRNSRINNCRVILAEKGTSLLAIASEYKISLHKLLDFNELTTDGMLDADQLIFLEKKGKTGASEFYISNVAESLRRISQKTGVQLSYICEYNNLQKQDMVHAGTKVYLRPRSTLREENKKDQSTFAPAEKFHKVLPKEGLYSIAKKYNVSIDALREWNSLQNDQLSIGQELIISQ